MPEWWIVVSGLFFAINVVFFVGLTVALYKLIVIANDLKPRIESLSNKVEALTEQVSQVTTKVDEVATSVRDTVHVVGGRARSVATRTGDSFEKFAPIVTTLLTALKVVAAIRQARGPVEPKHREIPERALANRPQRKR